MSARSSFRYFTIPSIVRGWSSRANFSARRIARTSFTQVARSFNCSARTVSRQHGWPGWSVLLRATIWSPCSSARKSCGPHTTPASTWPVLSASITAGGFLSSKIWTSFFLSRPASWSAPRRTASPEARRTVAIFFPRRSATALILPAFAGVATIAASSPMIPPMIAQVGALRDVDEGRGGAEGAHVDLRGLEGVDPIGGVLELEELDVEPLLLEEALLLGHEEFCVAGHRQVADPELLRRVRPRGERRECEREYECNVPPLHVVIPSPGSRRAW